jgi:D-tyrosyl-tRNA(Tyr) deacylase
VVHPRETSHLFKNKSVVMVLKWVLVVFSRLKFGYNASMKALIQRVKSAQVEVDDKIVGSIKQGILAFIGVEKQDDEGHVEKLLTKIINYRIFSDENGKMNLSLSDIHGELLLVSQFTLVANTQKGLRPSFSRAGDPQLSEKLYNNMIQRAQLLPITIQTGRFAADMQVSLVNDGPVTFNLHT